jgi:hypothetical protein
MDYLEYLMKNCPHPERHQTKALFYIFLISYMLFLRLLFIYQWICYFVDLYNDYIFIIITTIVSFFLNFIIFFNKI